MKIYVPFKSISNTAVTQSVRALISPDMRKVRCSNPSRDRLKYMELKELKISSDISTAKRLATGVSVTGSRR